jgi:nucleoside-diphosphate-sugar epimerase
MRVLVTGSRGFIGRHLVRELDHRGYGVIPVARPTGRGPDACDDRVRLVSDLGPHTDWEGVLGGVDVVVHLAAKVHDMSAHGPDADAGYQRVNALGTARLAAEAARCGVRRIVFVSSVKAMGEGRAEPWTIADTPNPGDPYGRSKLEGERNLLAVAASTRLEPVIIRPPLVYGPGVRANFLSMFRWVKSGVPLPFAAVKARRSLLGVANLVDLIIHCLDHPRAPEGVLLAAEAEPRSVPEMLQDVGAALDLPVRLFAVPETLLALASRFPAIGPRISRLTEGLVVDGSETCQRLTWRPPVTWQSGLKETAAWFQSSTAR